MHFTLKQLRYFDAAIRTGSIVKAAREMRISQSSVTAAIDQIEQSVGCALFHRIPAKGIQPTEEGEKVGARVAAYLEQTRLFESDVLSIAGGPMGTLHLACYAPTAPYVLPILLKAVAREYPDIRVDLREGDMESMNDELAAGTVDLALTYGRVLREGMQFAPLFDARPWVLLPEGWDIADRPVIRIPDLDDRPMIMLDLPATEVYFREVFKDAGSSLNVSHRTKSSSVLRGLVGADFGYSILNICGHGDRDRRSGYVARPLAGDLEAPTFGVACTAARRGSAVVQAVLGIAERLAAEGAFDALLMRPGDVSVPAREAAE